MKVIVYFQFGKNCF